MNTTSPPKKKNLYCHTIVIMRLISLLLRGKRKDRKCHWIRVSINFKFIEQLCILQSYGSALDPCELSVMVRERITIATGIPGGYELLGEWKKRQWSGHKECDRGQLREERREIRQGKWRQQRDDESAHGNLTTCLEIRFTKQDRYP